MLDSRLSEAIAQIHNARSKVVLEFAGAGSLALAWLHSIPGSSQTILEATDRYAKESLAELLGHMPEQFVSQEVAKTMAERAYHRAMQLTDGGSCIGIGCTASIATKQTKRGRHHCWVAARDRIRMHTYGVVLSKGLRERLDEERLVSQLILHALAEVSGVGRLPIELAPQEQLIVAEEKASDPIAALLDGAIASVLVEQKGHRLVNQPFRGTILSGSFNPLHTGHERLLQTAAQLLEQPGIFELPVINADKPQLGYAEVERRIAQFRWRYPVMLTRVSLFRDKAALFPGSTFVIGFDTAARLLEPRYYGGIAARDEALNTVVKYGCGFLVAGRLHNDRFQTLADLEVPAMFVGLFRPLPEHLFRVDLSSTQIRNS